MYAMKKKTFKSKTSSCPRLIRSHAQFSLDLPVFFPYHSDKSHEKLENISVWILAIELKTYMLRKFCEK